MSPRALVVVLLFGLFASCADQARWQEEFDQGTTALKANNLSTASTHFAAALSAAEAQGITGDRLAVTLGLYGGTLSDLGHPDQAEPLFRRHQRQHGFDGQPLHLRSAVAAQ